MSRIKPDNIKSCIRCGQCCLNGGPTLHREDIELIRQDILHPDCLFTIRKGEFVYHPSEDRLIAAQQEMIKIKGTARTWACVFFDRTESVCKIYENRPLECRILKCWDPVDSVRLFMQNTLSRRDIIPQGSALDEIISAYEERFPVGEFLCLFDKVGQDKNAATKISKMISLDTSFRSKFMESFGVKEAEMEFLFGRKLQDLTTAMGYLTRKAL
ncbi:MAG: YkgJ family cysteine cluster protein [Dissulfurimicrobium sp.]|uniref:YkgJ family cysteine cluster protein n=1 Tax=Dissulfurimicrobium sp. TaxID=2022436 RepID=UPI004049120E